MDRQPRGVLVGVDGSAGAARAIDWAVAEATSRGSALTLAYVLPPWPAPDVSVPADLGTIGERTALDLVDDAAAVVRSRAPQLHVEGLWLDGNPAAELLSLAADADEVVVGSRGRGGFAALTLGSVAGHVAAHAGCPVVVTGAPGCPGGPVVIGVDGSDRGEAALEFGFDHASRHGLAVIGMHVYHQTVPAVAPYPIVPMDVLALQRSARQVAGDAVRRWAEKYPDVPVEADADLGSAAEKLVGAGRRASLLVVGSRGHGGIAGLVLGSVSQAVLWHATCPVAVAR